MRESLWRIPFVPPKAKVYKFGAAWHWRCLSTACKHGGPSRDWETALQRALDHVIAHHRLRTREWVA